MTIRHKLIALGGVVLACLIALMLLTRYESMVMEELGEAAELAAKVESSMLTLRRHEKDFLARNDLKYLEKFNTDHQGLEEQLSELQAISVRRGLDQQLVAQLTEILYEYQALFAQVVEKQQTIGLHPKDGLYGSLRSAVHDAETLVRDQNDAALLSGILMLRRAEKDFMLRRDMKYLGKFDSGLASLNGLMEISRMAPAKRSALRTKLQNYAKRFKALVVAEQAIGLDPKSGLMGTLRDTVHRTEAQLATMETQITERMVDAQASLHLQAWGLFAAIALTVSALLTWIARSIFTRMQTLAQYMREITESHDLGLRAELGGNDELSAMGNDFNTMIASFQTTVNEVINASTQMSAAAEELSAITVQASAGIEQQNQEVNLVATAIHEMGCTLDEVAGNTERAALSAQDADQKANHGIGVVDQSIKQIYTMAEESETAANTASKLEVKAENIGSVLNVIKTIAEQTNLLALNAAIEAARAGEQGRGFAVVADEVRGLAQRTQESAAEIEEMVLSLQSGTEEVVKAIHKNSALAQDSVECARGASESLSEIMAAVSQIMNMNTQIAAATEEQARVANDINQNVVNIKQTADESSSAAQQSAVAGSQVAETAHRLHDSIRLFTA